MKRPASDMGAQDREDHINDVDMERGSSPADVSQGGTSEACGGVEVTPKAKQQDTGIRHRPGSSTDMMSQESNTKAFSQKVSSDESASAGSDSIAPTPSSISTAATSIRPESSSSSLPPIPSIDDQVAKVRQLMMKKLQDKQKGYVVTIRWLSRVLARCSDRAEGESFDKSATEGDIGPLDNSDLVLAVEGSGDLHDEAGQRFVPLRPGAQIGEDYEVVPEEAWELILQWYGQARGSPIITRYVHDTSTGFNENCQYELNPPVFSLLKLPGNHSDATAESIKETATPPIRMLASRSMPVNTWLRKAKDLVAIDVKSTVRVWKILAGLKSSSGSGMITPAASRSASPAPGAVLVASAGDRMILDVETFTSLRIGDERELLDVKDQTMNPKYNGTSTLSVVGLSRDEVVVLEEQIGGPAGGEWPSDVSKASKSHLTVSRSGAADRVRGKGFSTSGRSSPVPGVMTRGRRRMDGRPRGITGLQNLGNTCYMNSALQCVRSVEELTQYFLHDEYKKDLNPSNPLGHHGEVAKAYASLLGSMYPEITSNNAFSPTRFKGIIGKYGPSFSGYGQQDSQEFLLFLLDGLQEDLNRIHKKPYIEKPDSTDEMVHDQTALKELADKCWEIYKARNDSVITDLFAGMYKSTVICPVCDKVSIIFDPFNNLTLQLPIENNWGREVFYFPLHSRPIRVDVDIDKNSSIRTLKEFVAKRVNSDPDRIVMAEFYRSKFYKMFDNVGTIGEANIQSADTIGLYELDSVPTNYNPNKPKKAFSLYSKEAQDEIPDIGSPEAERLLVPVFNRLVKSNTTRNQQRTFFGEPMYVVITRDDSKDYDSVLRKVLGKVATMTTKNILDDDLIESSAINTPEDSDTLVMHDDGHSSDSNPVQAMSVEGEDGFVDVSMKDNTDGNPPPAAAEKAAHHPVLEPNSFIPPMLQNLFQLRVVQTGDAIPLGWNQIEENKEYPSVSERAARRVPHRPARRDRNPDFREGMRNSLSSDEDDAPLPPLSSAPPDDDSDLESNGEGKGESGSDSASDQLPSAKSIFSNHRPSSRRNSKQISTYSRKGKKNGGKSTASEDAGGLIRPGEAILLDWNLEAYDALFEGSETDDDQMRGAPTWKAFELYKDEELVAKRAQRQTRRRRGISLDDCLNEFGKMETLSENNAWYCPRCKEHRRATKKFELWKAPDILVMHLKRFSSNRNFRDKLEIFVDYPVEGLDLNDRVIMNEEGKSLVYDLVAVDNHYGGLGGGHYTAYAKNFFDSDKNWYEYNGERILVSLF